VQVFDADGNYLAMWNNVHRPDGMTIGPDGIVYIGELNGIAGVDDAPGWATASAFWTATVRSWHGLATQSRAMNLGSSSRRTVLPSIHPAIYMSARSRTPSAAGIWIRHASCATSPNCGARRTDRSDTSSLRRKPPANLTGSSAGPHAR
jgi:hypothetical protein